MALAKNVERTFSASEAMADRETPVLTNVHVFAGSALSMTDAEAGVRPLVAGNPFMGFARYEADNNPGATGDKKVIYTPEGEVELNVVGVTGPGDEGKDVFASDDGTFTLTSTSNSKIGKVSLHKSGTLCMVRFQGRVSTVAQT